MGVYNIDKDKVLLRSFLEDSIYLFLVSAEMVVTCLMSSAIQSSHTLDLLSRAHFLNHELLNFSILCSLNRPRTTKIIKCWFHFAWQFICFLSHSTISCKEKPGHTLNTMIGNLFL